MYLSDSAPRHGYLASYQSTSNCESQTLPITRSSRKTKSLFDLENFFIKKFLGGTESKVYLIKSKRTKELFALKVYFYEEEEPHKTFLNELQFAHLAHNNLIKIKASRYFDIIDIDNSQIKVSYIAQEYACFGDFYELLMMKEIEFSEKLVRTYFHQLIEALEYLHENKVAHLDIKLENLFLAQDYQLQIGDFGLAKPFDTCLKDPCSSPIYRAPEIKTGCCKDLAAADIYSAGVVLFALKSNGHFPFLEDNPAGLPEHNEKNSKNGDEAFWEHHTIFCDKSPDYYTSDFRRLFLSLTASNPNDRPTIQQIKQSVWYNKEIYSASELKKEMTILLNPY